jgi:hypothetical protein
MSIRESIVTKNPKIFWKAIESVNVDHLSEDDQQALQDLCEEIISWGDTFYDKICSAQECDIKEYGRAVIVSDSDFEYSPGNYTILPEDYNRLAKNPFADLDRLYKPTSNVVNACKKLHEWYQAESDAKTKFTYWIELPCTPKELARTCSGIRSSSVANGLLNKVLIYRMDNLISG